MNENSRRFVNKRLTDTQWHQILTCFADASIYQTTQYGRVSWGEGRYEHAVLYENQQPVCACQLRVRRFPMGMGGIAYSRWGPLWRPMRGRGSLEHLDDMLRMLHDEYVLKRGFSVVLLPRECAGSDESVAVESIFKKCGFLRKHQPQTTACLSLKPSLEQIRALLDKRWRRSLSKAERENIQVEVGTDPDLFSRCIPIYRQMVRRKQFEEFVDITAFDTINRLLPPESRIRTAVCHAEGGGPVSFAACSVLGDTAVLVFAGTGDAALKTNASFLAWWSLIKLLKEQGYNWLDVGGINKERNPGLYTFKSNLYKNNGFECTVLGQFWVHGSLVSRLISTAVRNVKLYSMKMRWLVEKKRGGR